MGCSSVVKCLSTNDKALGQSSVPFNMQGKEGKERGEVERGKEAREGGREGEGEIDK